MKRQPAEIIPWRLPVDPEGTEENHEANGREGGARGRNLIHRFSRFSRIGVGFRSLKICANLRNLWITILENNCRGTRFRLDNLHFEKAVAEEVVGRLKPGTATKCWVNPDSPAESVIEHEIGWKPFVAGGVFGIAALTTFAFAVAEMREWSTRGKSEKHRQPELHD